MTAKPQPRAGRRNALLNQLMEQYPVFRDGKPLAIGIHKALLEAQPDLEKNAVRIAMRQHTQSTRYLKGVVEGAPRLDLAGNPDGTVTAEQQAQAVATLKERIQKANERRKAEEEAKRRTEKLQKLADKFNTR